MPKRILIVTNSADLHADLVAEKLVSRAQRPFRIDLDAFPRDYMLDIEFSRGEWVGRLIHLPSNDAAAIGDIGAVWLRKPAPFRFASDDLSPQERAYAEMETEHVLFSVLYSLRCYWMSHPLSIRGALWKGEQLQRATSMGFRVPRSLISNQPASVRRFKADVAADMIFKAMSSASLGADVVPQSQRVTAGLRTTRITDEDDGMLDAVRELPSLFQEYVPKQYELRVTVIGAETFAARIYSQDDERTATDYRDMSAEIRYRAELLPSMFARRCVEFVHSYELTFGALDFIVTPAGEYVFLENNPVGQFLFVEQLVPELKMLDAVADRLIEGAHSGG
jgi:glutathione synthase/RimK-type ligase-like ATP-grasp enzyme